MPFVIPVGEDFADGLTSLPAQPSTPSQGGGTPLIIGTPLPTANIFIYANSNYPIEEQPGSPKSERAEQYTCEHTLKMYWTETFEYITVMPRGTVVTDTHGNIWKILSCDHTRLDGTLGELHYVMECISSDSPPDDFDIIPSSLDLNIIKHPRYWWALSPYVGDETTFTTVGDTDIYYQDQKEAIIRMIQNYIESPFYPSQAQVQGLIQSNILASLNPPDGNQFGYIQVNYPNDAYDGSQATVDPVPWDGVDANLPKANCTFFVISIPYAITDPNNPILIAIAAAKEIISKLWRQEDTPLLEGYEVVWTQYFYQPVYLNPGGYQEDPRDWVPDYFLDPANGYGGFIIPRGEYPSGNNNSDTVAPPSTGGVTIFDLLPVINPQSYSSDGTTTGQLVLSSLRKADSYTYDRTFFKVTHRWLVAPVGKWDADLYHQYGEDGPQNADDFNINPQDRASL